MLPLANNRQIALAPDDHPEYREAIIRGGGNLVPLSDGTRALVWSRHGGAAELHETVSRLPAVCWVQLPSAGVENFITADAMDNRITWTSAKGAYARPVAEHALALTLALLRQIQVRARARRWGPQAGATLFGAHVLILGGGGIGKEFARLLEPFEVRITVCRRDPVNVAYANQTVDMERFSESLTAADVLLLAAPLTPQTEGLISATTLGLMKPSAILVNVARGGLVVTSDLAVALAKKQIAGAALDVTDPEPLPERHPLWTEERALITPHSADTADMIIPLLAGRIESNVARFLRGDSLLGRVDLEYGY